MDVDGSYSSKKRQRLEQTGVCLPDLGIPPIPPMGWETVTEQNFGSLTIPKLSSGMWSQCLPVG